MTYWWRDKDDEPPIPQAKKAWSGLDPMTPAQKAERERKQAERDKEITDRHLAELKFEYRVHGLEPAYTSNGVLLSLSMARALNIQLKPARALPKKEVDHDT